MQASEIFIARKSKRGYNTPRSIGAWRSPASALAWGARGRRFKSSRPDREYEKSPAGRAILFFGSPVIDGKALKVGGQGLPVAVAQDAGGRGLRLPAPCRRHRWGQKNLKRGSCLKTCRLTVRCIQCWMHLLRQYTVLLNWRKHFSTVQPQELI